MVIAPDYPMAWGFADGLAPVFVGGKMFGNAMDLRGSGKWGYIDKTGALKFQCGIVTPLREGKAFVYEGPGGGREAWAIVDEQGKVLAKGLKFKDASLIKGFAEGLAAVGKTADRKNVVWGYMDSTGKIVIEQKYFGAGDFNDGLAPVGSGDESGTNAERGKGAKTAAVKWGFIDKTGATVLASNYEAAGRFSEGLAAVSVGGKWGCIDKKGTVVIAPQFDCFAPFFGGLARVVNNGKHGFVNAEGKIAVEPRFDTAWDFSEGLARVEIAGKQGYIDATGKFVWAPTN
jgi:hypothetical protein